MLRVFTKNNLKIGRILLGGTALALFTAVNGCTYKTEIRQGNNLLPAYLEKIEVGMTRKEVTSLLGSPQTEKIFSEESLIYYYKRRSDGFKVSHEALGVEIVFDENDTVQDLIPLKSRE
ncbi:MAG: outer membrane protein assembly factor BamE [Candidatus Zeuxoniibacter abyssi]|nr:MAG: outer membrane protein assembly factor BamE [Candidatus Persebacteraceae bacterium AB1(2)]